MPLDIPFVRTVVLGWTSLLALDVLGLSAYTLNQTTDFLGVYLTYSVLGIATAVLHFSSVTAMIIADRLRDGAFTSKLSFQVGWLSFLSIMWFATGAKTAVYISHFPDCTDTFCGVTRGITTFGFIIWAILFGYIVILIMVGVRAGQAGHNVWMTDVKEVQWVQEPISHEKGDINSPNPTVAATYPPGGNPNSGVPTLTSQP
ncbi:hypothetical protein BDM02DRAFT_3269079 [Thelephora ganbajun]|uniref:Uncharacterized protein n=1 Tax=Thelephora ganbajun TaxID=370292 RepID=A0ACB6ZHB9_THEGA|nr:hypothetical protein BDM02DRAFT_3269079 [Thelephora ganbajun]